MNIELEKKLAEKYPFMRRGKGLEEQQREGFIYDLYGAFGCDVDDGWYELLDSLCGEIVTAYGEAGVPVDIVIDQVKQKCGGLRFYYHREPESMAPDTNETTESLSASSCGELSALDERLMDIVSKWEDKAETTCEKCGEPGIMRVAGYIRTLCDACYFLEEEWKREHWNRRRMPKNYRE